MRQTVCPESIMPWFLGPGVSHGIHVNNILQFVVRGSRRIGLLLGEGLGCGIRLSSGLHSVCLTQAEFWPRSRPKSLTLHSLPFIQVFFAFFVGCFFLVFGEGFPDFFLRCFPFSRFFPFFLPIFLQSVFGVHVEFPRRRRVQIAPSPPPSPADTLPAPCRAGGRACSAPWPGPCAASGPTSWPPCPSWWPAWRTRRPTPAARSTSSSRLWTSVCRRVPAA